jgi:hypothetical protein
MGEVLFLQSIFQKEDNENYSRNAQLYQDMLRYCKITLSRQERLFQGYNNNDDDNNNNHDTNSSFTYRELASWLMEGNNEEFKHRYHNKDSQKKDKIENSQKRIKNKLSELIELGLIKSSGSRKQQKGNGTISLYKFTEFGYLLALIIESFDSSKASSVNDEIYDLLQLMFKIKENSSSSTILYSNFFKKCKEKGVFRDIVSLFGENLRSNRRYFINVLELIRATLRLNFKNKEKNIIFNHIFNETINELDAKTRNLVLFHLKLEIEQLMEDMLNDHNILFDKDNIFEKARFAYREFPRIICLIAYCPLCNLYYPIGLSLLEYREELMYVREDFLVGCPRCKLGKTLFVPVLL